MKTRDLNTCTHCPHTILDIGNGVLFCPCEDCHVGGLVQGREPFALAGVIPTQSTTTVDNSLTVDPLHSFTTGGD